MIGFTYIIGSILKKKGLDKLVILINLVFGAIGGTLVFVMRMYSQLVPYAIKLVNIFRMIFAFVMAIIFF